MKPWDEIVADYTERKRARGSVVAQMADIRDRYNGEWVVPLPELDRNEEPMIANLINQGIDQKGMRIASVLPDCYYPPLRPGIDKSESRARARRQATLGWWEMNRLGLRNRRWARQLIAYSCAAVQIKPDFDREIPAWHFRDPLTTYPAPTADPDDLTPPDCIFVFSRSLSWLKRFYPEAANRVTKGPEVKPDTRFDLLEYVDAAEHVMGVLGKHREDWHQPEWGMAPSVELMRTPNRAGVCTAVVAGRITLDRPKGEYDEATGLQTAEAKAMGLWMHGVARGVFPDRVVIGRPGETPNIIAGPFDGVSGDWSIISGGDVKDLTSNPTYLAENLLNRLERGQRIGTGTPAEFGGEAPSNVRTGRRGQQVLSAVIDFPIQEAQEIRAAAMFEEDCRAIAVAKGYFDAPRSFYVGYRNAQGTVTYTPSETFETDRHTVTFSQPGADANNLIIGIGQRIGVGTLSKKTAMQMDPLVVDWESEMDQIQREAMIQAVLGGLVAALENGTIPPSDGALIGKLLETKTLFDAIEEAQQRAQERQAAQAPPGAPETQPGLAAPGQGAEAGVAITPPEASLTNFRARMGALRGPAMTLRGQEAAGA